MLVLIVEIEVKRDAVARFEKAMRAQAEQSLANEPGCHAFSVCRSETAPETILLYEEYDDDAAFQAHMDAQHTREFFSVASELIEAKRETRFVKLAG